MVRGMMQVKRWMTVAAMVLTTFGPLLTAQVRSGIRFGAAFPLFETEPVVLTGKDGLPLYRISVDRIGTDFNGGMFLQMQFGALFLQPEVYYHFYPMEYRIDTLYTSGAGSATVRETFRGIDFPLMVGIKIGVLRIGAGPVGHLALNSDEGFADYEDIDESFTRWRWGLQGGLGFDFWKLHLELRYASNLATVGEHIASAGQTLDFGTKDHRFLAAVGFSF